ncbi:hypothetical protein CTZ27_17210 [Streptomyces griseocarneus]|nr:hypothetical protein CTZ27_17210 [Streptomyces griseocarneus]
MLAGVGFVATTVPAGAAGHATGAAPRAAACEGVDWGSQRKDDTGAAHKPLQDITAGQHECFDRLVFEAKDNGDNPLGYHVGYVDKLHQDGSGDEIPVAGGAVLDIRVGAPSYDPATGKRTYPGRVGEPLRGVDVSGYRTFRDTRYAGSFEGDTQVGLGVRARLPFRVFQWGNKVIVDVAHTWDSFR